MSSRQPLLSDRILEYDPRASFGIRSSSFNLAPQNMVCTSMSFRRRRPKRVSNYILGPILGEGSYGVVRDAIDTANMQRVAVKCIKKDFRDGKNAQRIEQQLVAEVEYLQRFHHPSLIRALDVFCSAQGKDYMVLPVAVCSLQQFVDAREEEMLRNSSFASYGSVPNLAGGKDANGSPLGNGSGRAEHENGYSPKEGSPLLDSNHGSPAVAGNTSNGTPGSRDSSFAFTRRKLIPAALAKDIVYQILSGVDYMHRQKLHHNDIKPENILLFADGHVKITDLGSTSSQFVGRGTPAYLSPDATGLIEDAIIDPAANDCWAVGVLLYLLSTNKLPFQGHSTEFQLFHAIVEQPVDFDAIEDPVLQSLLKGLLEKSQVRRVTAAEALTHPWFKAKAMPSSFRKESGLTVQEDTASKRETLREEISTHNIRRLLNVKDIAELLELDTLRHKQFCHETRFILGLSADSDASQKEMDNLRPCFLPQSEVAYYSRKGKPENDVRSLRQDTLKLSTISTYCTRVIEGEDANGARGSIRERSGKSRKGGCPCLIS